MSVSEGSQPGPTFTPPLQTRLQDIWGYHEFRPFQRAIIEAILCPRDVLAILPTGGGKSLCFQLPALYQSGLTVVISPLLALMEDQVQTLRRLGISATVLHSEQSRRDRQQAIQAIASPHLKLLYLAPESFLSPSIWERLTQTGVSTLVVDEAHCITQWGDRFRPVYRRLGAARRALTQPDSSLPPNLAAFTATAAPATQAEIQAVLELENPATLQVSPYRRQLFLKVRRVWSIAQRRHQLFKFMQAHPHQSGLVYTRSRRACEELAQRLNDQGYKTAAYHGGIAAPHRRQIEQDWQSGQLPCVICTSAFGMGVNKPDCRWICHFQPPATLGEYLQEVGRAGRDGQSAAALLLASEPTGWLDPSDRQLLAAFARQEQRQMRQALSLIPTLPQSGTLSARADPNLELALALLHQQGRLTWLDPFRYRIHPPQQNGQLLGQQSIASYLKARGCRWQYLLNAFGFRQTHPCGHCDRCVN